jgi:hypothetical protein
MRGVLTGFGLGAGLLALILSAAAPARAEFFGCGDRPGQLLYTYNGTPSGFHDRYSGSRYSDNYSRPRMRYSRAGSSYYDDRHYYSDEHARW